MQVPVEKIKILKRIRMELGDLEPLMNSLKKYGQLNPIIIDADYNLIAGHRRLQSARNLGWSYVEAVISDVDDVSKIELEMEENMQRKNLTPDEIENGYEKLNQLLNPGFFQRIINFFKRLFRRLFRNKK